MNEFAKRPWLLPAAMIVSLPMVMMVAVLTHNAIICASLGDWVTMRRSLMGTLIPIAGLVFFWWLYATIHVQRIGDEGVTALTLRGRVALPWSAIQRARFEHATALLDTGSTRTRIGFAMYRDYRAAEAFARTRLTEGRCTG